MLIDELGCWLSCIQGFRTAGGKPALFVDRDNLLIDDPGFIHRPEQVVLKPGAAAFLRGALDRDWPIVVVTNQSGIARGLYGWGEFDAVNQRMMELLATQGARVHAILACAWHPDGRGALARHHDWRKPSPGMIQAAAVQFDIGLRRSWMAGDRLTDIRAARAAGLAGAMWVRERFRHVRIRHAGDGFRLVTAPMLSMLRAYAIDPSVEAAVAA